MKIGPAEGGAEGDPDDEQEANPEGCYAVRFWRDNQWRIVVVDDFIPGEFLVCHHTPTYQCSLT